MPYSHIEAVLARTDHFYSDNKTIKETKQIITLLINNHAPISGTDKYGQGIISRVIHKNCESEGVIHLINSVDTNLLNCQVNEFITPLQAALYEMRPRSKYNSFNANIEIVQKLLDNKADINFQDTEGNTPLISACNMKDEKSVKLLLENNADINCQNSQGNTALIKACANGNKELVKLLLEHGDCDVNL